jgi:hypothetical protein
MSSEEGKRAAAAAAAVPPPAAKAPPRAKHLAPERSRVGKTKPAQESFLRRALLPSACASLFLTPTLSAEDRLFVVERVVDAAVAKEEKKGEEEEKKKKPEQAPGSSGSGD